MFQSDYRISKDLAYKFLENPELSKVSGREWLQAIFGYLKVICIDYNEVSSEFSFFSEDCLFFLIVSLLRKWRKVNYFFHIR